MLYITFAAWTVIIQVAANVVGGGEAIRVLPIAEPPKRIGAFNIQVFGKTKYGVVGVRNILAKILARYDILLVQEIRDASNESIHKLVNLTNTIYRTNDPLSIVLSERLGQSTSKEQYAYLYRGNSIELVSTYQYTDPDNKFQRPPFAAKFRSKELALGEFAIIGIHTSPSRAFQEIDALKDVYTETKRILNVDSILIAGDFNGDCSYVKQHEMRNISIRADPSFQWLIGDNTDTTVSGTDCAYDRLVVKGDNWFDAIVPGTVGVFHFNEEYNIGLRAATIVSDHYPVEMNLTGRTNIAMQSNVRTYISAKFEDTIPVENVHYIRKMYYTSSPIKYPWNVRVYDVRSRRDHVIASRTNLYVDNVIPELLQFNVFMGQKILSPSLISVINSYIKNEYKSTFQEKPYVYGLKQTVTPYPTYDLDVKCYLQVPYICQVELTKKVS